MKYRVPGSPINSSDQRALPEGLFEFPLPNGGNLWGDYASFSQPGQGCFPHGY